LVPDHAADPENVTDEAVSEHTAPTAQLAVVVVVNVNRTTCSVLAVTVPDVVYTGGTYAPVPA
jgi:hypothetical protein